jgi:hypothetical protein
MREWLRKAVAAVPVSTWLLSLGASYLLGTVVHDCVYSRYAEAAVRAGMLVYILPTLVASLRRHPNFRLLIQTNLLLGVTIAGWLVCFVWSCCKHAKTKHMLLYLIIISRYLELVSMHFVHVRVRRKRLLLRLYGRRFP